MPDPNKPVMDVVELRPENVVYICQRSMIPLADLCYHYEKAKKTGNVIFVAYPMMIKHARRDVQMISLPKEFASRPEILAFLKTPAAWSYGIGD